MVRINFYLEGFVGKDGKSAVKARFSSGGNSVKKPTSVRCGPDDWIGGRPTSKRDAAILDGLSLKVKTELYDMREATGIFSMDKDELNKFVNRVMGFEDSSVKSFLLSDIVRKCSEGKSNGTRHCYEYAVLLLSEFKCGNIAVNEINYLLLVKFQSWMEMRGLSVNSIGVVMRSLRALVNYAIEEGVYRKEYPFRRFKIKTEETAKRSLSVGKVRTLLSIELDGGYDRARDLFMLSFYLVGMNFVDLCNGSYTIEDDHLSYIRQKTGKRITVPLVEHAKVLLLKYDTWLRGCVGNDLLHKRRALNRYLGAIGAKLEFKSNKVVGTPLFPGITYYWARHTWATLAAELEIPKETISAAMGHSSGSVTDIYIRFDRRKIDEANRKVIDFVKSDAVTAEEYLRRIEDDRILDMARRIIEARDSVLV